MKLIKQDSGFTQVPNELLNDKTLSLKAKGLYSYMYSKPDNWNFTIKSMIKLLQDGERSITTALNELKDANWLYHQKLKTGKGIYFISTSSNASEIFKDEILPKLQNVDVANPSTVNPLVEPNLQNDMMAFCSPISNIVTINNKTTTKEEERKIKKELSNIAKDEIDKIDIEYKSFMNYNHNKFRNMQDLKEKWKKWIYQVIKYSSKKLKDVPKKQKQITYELVSEKIDKDLIMAIVGNNNKEQQQYISEKLEDFINYCVKNQKNYENYEDSFENYLEIGRQNGWNF